MKKLSVDMGALQVSRKRGFSLLELSVVLAIIGVVLAGSLTVGLGAMEASRVNETVSRMDAIHKALLNYSINFSRLPCPSSLTLAETNANYGIEGANKGTCTGGTPAANNTAASGTVEGGVPTRTLQLPDEYMYDGWGRRIRYSVNPDYTADDTMPVGTGSCTSTKAITVKDAAAGDRSTNSVYALISHGANGHGGYTRNGVMFNAGSTNTDEQTNCHCDASAVATTYSATYVQKLPTESSSTATDKFDDIVSYRDGWQLQTFTSPLSSEACASYMWVVDNVNNRVKKLNVSDGSFITQVGCASGACAAGTADGEFTYAVDVASDSQGNIFVVDLYNYKVQKFSSNGTFLLRIGTSYGTGNTQFQGPLAVAVDADDNVWVVDAASTINIVKKFNGTTGAYMARIGCGGGAGYCATSSANGYFSEPGGVAIDGDGNIWVSDYGNNRLQKFSSAGTHLLSTGTTGSGNGQFNGPYSIAADASNNVWVVDYNNSRWQQLDSSGNYVSKFGAYGTGNGDFDHAWYIEIGPDGNLWTSGDDNRVQHLTTSGTWIKQFGGCSSGSCSTGAGNGQFNAAAGVAFADQ